MNVRLGDTWRCPIATDIMLEQQTRGCCQPDCCHVAQLYGRRCNTFFFFLVLLIDRDPAWCVAVSLISGKPRPTLLGAGLPQLTTSLATHNHTKIVSRFCCNPAMSVPFSVDPRRATTDVVVVS